MTHSGLWLPSGIDLGCEHPAEALVGGIVPTGDGTADANILCCRCHMAWDQDTIPPDVILKVVERIEAGETTSVERVPWA